MPRRQAVWRRSDVTERRRGVATLPFLTALEARLGERGPLVALLLPAVAVVGVAQGWPLIRSLQISFLDWSLARSPLPGPYTGFSNYTKAMSDTVFLGAFEFTALLAVCSTVLQMVLGLSLALLAAGEGFVFRLSRTLLLLPMVVAPVAAGTMWRMMLSGRVGPVNRVLAALGIDGPNWLGDPGWARLSVILIDAWEWTPFVTIVFAAALASLPQDVIRAASVDGAGRWRVFRDVVWPMLLPAAILVGMFRVIDGLLTLDVIFTTTFGGPGFTTHTLGFWIYQQGLRYFNLGTAAAMSWLLLILCVLVACVLLAWRRHAMRWQAA